jgi:hypothetical protein
MSVCGGFGRSADGYYDETGHWQRTKFCFVSCGDRCTCRPPMGYYSEAHDKGLNHDEGTANTSTVDRSDPIG